MLKSSAFHRPFHAVGKHQRHPIAGREPDQFAIRFRFTKMRRVPDELIKLLKYLGLIASSPRIQMHGITTARLQGIWFGPEMRGTPPPGAARRDRPPRFVEQREKNFGHKVHGSLRKMFDNASFVLDGRPEAELLNRFVFT